MNVILLIFAFITGALVAFVFLKSKNSKLEIENIKLQEKINSYETSAKSKEEYTELIKKEFTNLANQALLEKNKSLDEENRKNLETFLNPLKEKIREFQGKIEEYNITGIKNTQTLKEQIDYLSAQNKLITTQTEKLANAMSTNSKFRGSFGEMVLEKMLRISGLVNKKDDPIKGNYLLQTGFRDLNNPGGRKINPDAVIYLAEGNKNIIIDSKAPIAGYLDYTNAQNEDEAGTCIKEFYQNTLERVKELENKYANLEGLDTPDFTLLFIPFEACMGLIYANNQLIEEANKRNIIIAGPSTLLATLRTINYAWMSKHQNDNVKEILKSGQAAYSKCQALINKLEEISAAFDTLRKRFDNVFTSLQGKGGLIGQISRFKDLGFNPANPIDEKYLAETGDPLALDALEESVHAGL